MEWRDPVVIELCAKHGTDNPRDLIVRLCRELCSQYPTDSGPTPLDVLGSVRLIRRISPASLPIEGCSGILYPVNGGYEMAIEASEDIGRQRWSIAHEIVHTFFLEVNPSATRSEEQEQLCDVGAAELLLPIDRVTGRLADAAIAFETVRRLNDEFGTSFVAAGRRMVELARTAACFLGASRPSVGQGPPGDDPRPLRIDFSTISPTWTQRGDYEGETLSTDCLIGRAFDQQRELTGRGTIRLGGSNIGCNVEAVGYEFRRSGNVYRTVAALLTSFHDGEATGSRDGRMSSASVVARTCLTPPRNSESQEEPAGPSPRSSASGPGPSTRRQQGSSRRSRSAR